MDARPSLDNTLRTDLINLLCDYPPLTTREGRDAWLLNLPQGVRNLIVRRHEHYKIDIAFIIDAIQGVQLQDGRWALLILLGALSPEVKGLRLENELAELRQKVQEILEPPVPLDSAPTHEEIVIGEDEKVHIGFLENGLKAARAVARVMVIRTIGGQMFGTGWLIAPGLLITNHHVVAAREGRRKRRNARRDGDAGKSRAALVWVRHWRVYAVSVPRTRSS